MKKKNKTFYYVSEVTFSHRKSIKRNEGRILIIVFQKQGNVRNALLQNSVFHRDFWFESNLTLGTMFEL